MNRLTKDIDVAHRRRWPDRPISLASRLWLLAISSGLRMTLMHRIAYRSNLDRKNGGWRAWFWRAMVIPLAPLKFAIKINTKSAIPNDCEIENGVCFSDQGHILFGARKTGTGTVISTRVTIGQNHFDCGRPEIGRNVWIGSDCVIYGAISIGDAATLLPGTVLGKSIPAGVVMQGNPAQLVLRDFDNSELRAHQDVDAMQYMKTKRGED